MNHPAEFSTRVDTENVARVSMGREVGWSSAVNATRALRRRIASSSSSGKWKETFGEWLVTTVDDIGL